jgi:nucleoside-diphosphate-sugar epimerase
MNQKIILPGGAGLIGQNLVLQLKAAGYHNLVVIDKHKNNLQILQQLHPDVHAIHADLSLPGAWQAHFKDADIVVMLQAQIGGLYYDEFVKNTVESTRLILNEMHRYAVPYIVHISSSVVQSSSNDFYTQTKRMQEKMILDSHIPNVIFRPTIMFGWFDRKHFGWLAHLMKKIPIFPVPGNGRYTKQPLYVGDFCNIVVSAIKKHITGEAYNISGQEHICYIDVIKEIKQTIQSKTVILKIPYQLFYALIYLWSLVDRNPPFTIQQLQYLVSKNEFEVIDWPTLFDIKATDFKKAIEETFNHSIYSHVMLRF